MTQTQKNHRSSWSLGLQREGDRDFRAVPLGLLTHRSLKGPLEAGQLIEDTAQGPDVALLVVGLALTQFRGDVAWSAHHLQEGS